MTDAQRSVEGSPAAQAPSDPDGRGTPSRELYERARQLFAEGVTHEARRGATPPPYIQRAQGPYKWDEEGRRYIDYWMGHGALILGHGHPAVVEAVKRQIEEGTHFGGSHRLEVEWGERVRDMVPCAERLRFTSSGTEAAMMAMRLARAFTGRDRIVKFHHHFHGWSDYATVGMAPPYDVPVSAGVPAAVAATVTSIPPGDEELLRKELAKGDVAAVIFEPSGGGWATNLLDPEFIPVIRRLTEEYGALMIMDEVITGFRYAPGGAQELFHVVPDLCVLAKILAGGLPGAAVAGRADIMAAFETTGDPEADRYRRIPHPGTYNANPLSAAAGVAALDELRDGTVQRHAAAMAERLRRGWNDVLRRHDVAAVAYGQSSLFHVYFAFEDEEAEARASGDPVGYLGQPAFLQDPARFPRLAAGGPGQVQRVVKNRLLERGVDLMRTGGFLSGAHTEKDIDATIAAFDDVIGELKAEGVL